MFWLRNKGIRCEDLAIHVRRKRVEDSFRELFRRSPDEWKHRFYIVFEGMVCNRQGSHSLEKYLNLEGFLEKFLKIKSALKSTEKSLKSLEKSLNSTIFCRTVTL